MSDFSYLEIVKGMRHLTPILILAVSLCWGSRVFSQNNDSDLLIKYRDVTVEDGLSSRFVYRIFQDSDNYMWFVTSEGLNRYDGYRMDVFHLRRIGGRVHFPYYIMEDCASNF